MNYVVNAKEQKSYRNKSKLSLVHYSSQNKCQSPVNDQTKMLNDQIKFSTANHSHSKPYDIACQRNHALKAKLFIAISFDKDTGKHYTQ